MERGGDAAQSHLGDYWPVSAALLLVALGADAPVAQQCARFSDGWSANRLHARRDDYDGHLQHRFRRLRPDWRNTLRLYRAPAHYAAEPPGAGAGTYPVRCCDAARSGVAASPAGLAVGPASQSGGSAPGAGVARIAGDLYGILLIRAGSALKKRERPLFSAQYPDPAPVSVLRHHPSSTP